MDNKNLSAFPLPVTTNASGSVRTIYDYNDEDHQVGLTKREYFAVMALQGYLANPNPGTNTICAEMAVLAADALLAELEK